jgi:predicted DNA-binding transcriptional regulator YafY
MPKSKEQHLRYRIIDQELRKHPRVKTRDLQKVIEDVLQETVDVRTIQKDIKDMKEDTRLGFDAPIEYDKHEKAYKYTDRGYSISNFSLQSDEIAALKFYAACLQLYSNSGLFRNFSSAIDKIISGISLKQRLKKDTNPDLIIQTDTFSHPAGSEWLEYLVQAIDDKSNVSFQYKKFNDSSTAQTRVLSPYLLKEFHNRWYVLGMVVADRRIKTFALDRMTDLRFSPGEYVKDPAFNPEVYFKHCLGITASDEPVQKIVLQFSKEQIPYVKSLPVHPTQTIMEETPDQITISIEVIPSYELYEYILGKTPDIRVLAPKKISNRVKNLLKKGLERNSGKLLDSP